MENTDVTILKKMLQNHLSHNKQQVYTVHHCSKVSGQKDFIKKKYNFIHQGHINSDIKDI